MKRVKLLEIKEFEMVVSTDYVQIHHFNPRPVFIKPDEFAASLDSTVIREDVPIVKYVVNGHTTYLAITRQLESILGIPYKEKIEELSIKNKKLQCDLLREQAFAIDIKHKQREWWSQSVFKRVWQAIKGKQ